MGRIKELLFDEILQDKMVDDDYLFNKFKQIQEDKIWEYEQLQNLIKQSDVSSFFQQ